MIYLGVLISFNSTPYTAVVELRGSRVVRLVDVPVSRAIASGEMVADRLVAVWFAGPGDVPAEAVVIAVWT